MQAIIKILFHSSTNRARIHGLLIFIAILFCISSPYLSADELNLRPARHIADSVLSEGFTEILKRSGLSAGDTISVKDIGKGSNIYIVFKLEHFLQEKGIFINKNPEKKYPEFRLLVDNFGFQYENTDDPDNIQRKFELGLSISPTNYSAIDDINFESTDTIPRLFYFQEKHYQHPYSNGKLPEPDGSFWDEIAEPALVISAAVISVITLFSVRSK